MPRNKKLEIGKEAGLWISLPHGPHPRMHSQGLMKEKQLSLEAISKNSEISFIDDSENVTQKSKFE